MKLALIHGRSQGGKDAIKLKAEWLEALQRGLQKCGLTMPTETTIEFPFYGDRLDEFVRQFELPADPAIVPKGNPAFEEYADFRLKVAQEIQARAGITDAAVQAECRDTPTEKGLQNWEWVQAIVRLVDRRLTGISQTTIEVFLRDVFLYTRREAVREAIDRIVSSLVAPDAQVVVAHSLGSVVAYNVLKKIGGRVPLYVTVGSPLAIRAVRSALGPISNPSGAKGWYNAFDPHDVVALYPLDRANFDVEPGITNNGLVHNWTDNRHGIAGYLDDANVARIVYSALSQ